MRSARDYGPYARLMRRPAVRALVKALDAASGATGVRYLVIGGSAVYLHTARNPEDYPDLDVVLDASKTAAKRFMRALGAHLRRRPQKLAETESDAFWKLAWRGLDVDVFTEQEDRPNLGVPVRIRGIPVKAIEGLIVEKLSRFSYPDVLMLFDLLRKRHDAALVRRHAQRIGALGRLEAVRRIARSGASAPMLRRWAAVMAGGERPGHLV